VRKTAAPVATVAFENWDADTAIRTLLVRVATVELEGSSAALFWPRLDDAQVRALLEQRRLQGVFELDDNKVIYSLPD